MRKKKKRVIKTNPLMKECHNVTNSINILINNTLTCDINAWLIRVFKCTLQPYG